VTVDTAAGPVTAGGFDDPHLAPPCCPPRRGHPAEGSEATLHLGLVHAPYLAALDVLVDAGHDLLLAGHTHGGQVRLPGIGALVANCDLPLDQAAGCRRYRGRWLHVSAGLGHSPYAPFRFACRPEATLLELTAEGSHACLDRGSTGSQARGVVCTLPAPSARAARPAGM
jgi:uncharacterized protein